MKSVVIFALFVAAAVAAPLEDSKNAQIVKQEFDNIGVEGYKYGAQTSDGKSVSEEGVLTYPGTEQEAIAVRGQFSYVGPDGVTYAVKYTAGVEGFKPEGAHLPVA